MYRIRIYRDLCKSCGLCVEFCPKGLIHIDSKLNKRGVEPAKFEETDGKKCAGCGNCAAICPDAAIEIDEVPDDEPAKPCAKK